MGALRGPLLSAPSRAGRIHPALIAALAVPLLIAAAWFAWGGRSATTIDPLLTPTEVADLAPDLAGDVHLLRCIRQRLTGPFDGSGLRAELRPLYVTLRMEEMARTEGWDRSLVAPAGDVVQPQAAAAAYRELGVPEAIAVMERLDGLLATAGPTWSARAEAERDGLRSSADADRASLARLSADLDRLLPRIRAARLAWTRTRAAGGP